MKRTALTITILLLFTGHIFSQSIPGLTFGGDKNDYGLTICKAHGGGYVLAGSTRSYGSGSNDFYLLILDTGGSVLHEKVYGWEHHDIFRKVIPVDNGYMLVGDAWDWGPGGLDIYTLNVDYSGNSLKGNLYGTSTRENGFDILPADDNGYLILGHSRLKNPKGDVYLIKTDHDGTQLWEQSYWDEGNDYGFQIIKSNQNDGYLIVGSKNGFFDDVHADFQTHDADILLIKIDKDGNQIWKKTFGSDEHDFGYSLSSAPGGGYYLLGSSQSGGNGSFDMALIHTDDDGNELWTKYFGGASYEYGKSLAVTDSGYIYLLGSTKSFGTEGSVDIYLVKTDSEGNEIWSTSAGTENDDFGEQIIALSNGGCAVAGTTGNRFQNGNDLYFLRFTASGVIDIFENISPPENKEKALIYPNPMSYTGNVVLPGDENQINIFRLTNTAGAIVLEQKLQGNKAVITKGTLSSGIYFYQIIQDSTGKVLFSGKLIIR